MFALPFCGGQDHRHPETLAQLADGQQEEHVRRVGFSENRDGFLKFVAEKRPPHKGTPVRAAPVKA